MRLSIPLLLCISAVLAAPSRLDGGRGLSVRGARDPVKRVLSTPEKQAAQDAKDAAKAKDQAAKQAAKDAKAATKSPAATKAAAAAATTAPAAKTTTPASTGSGAGTGDDQSSLTLLASQVMPGLAKTGQETPAAGQVQSLTSTNNFINYCATQPNLPLTNGLQTKSGSCNPTPMGVILATTKMPASKFTFPANGGKVSANKDFTIKMAIQNLKTGNFVNAQANYYAAPAQVDGSGTLIGHSHVVIQKIDSLGSTNILDPNTFAFFKGLNEAAVGGELSATVTGGLPAGTYRMASINSAANHQPALVAVAQHGSLDDMVYFSVA